MVEGSKELFKKLNILEVLKFFSEERSLVLEEQVLGFEMKHFIMDVNQDKIRQLTREFFKDRPKKMPEIQKEKISHQTKEEKMIQDEKLKQERLLKRMKYLLILIIQY